MHIYIVGFFLFRWGFARSTYLVVLRISRAFAVKSYVHDFLLFFFFVLKFMKVYTFRSSSANITVGIIINQHMIHSTCFYLQKICWKYTSYISFFLDQYRIQFAIPISKNEMVHARKALPISTSIHQFRLKVCSFRRHMQKCHTDSGIFCMERTKKKKQKIIVMDFFGSFRSFSLGETNARQHKIPQF